MPTFKKTFISNTENLRTIRPVVWREIQKYCPDALTSVGISIPEDDEQMDDEFYTKLCEDLKAVEASEQTARLVDVLVGLDEFSSHHGEGFHETLQTIAEENGIEEAFMQQHGIDENEQLSTVELAILLMTNTASASRFQSYRTILSVDKSTFAYFNCQHEDGTPVVFNKPSEADVIALATKFKQTPSLKKQLKITDYCVINMFERDTINVDDNGNEQEGREWVFTICRSNRPVVSASVDHDKVVSLIYTPPTTDVVIANPETKQLRTNTQSTVRCALYLSEISGLLSPDKKPNIRQATMYTFAPLEKVRWQTLFNTANIEGLSCVRLKEVHQRASGENGQAIDVIVKAQARRSLALFAQSSTSSDGSNGIDDLGKFHAVTRMGLEFIFEGEARTPVVVKIPDPGRLCIKRKQHAPEVQLWLQKQGFVAQPTLDFTDEEDEA